jgi:hypothetical protein
MAGVSKHLLAFEALRPQILQKLIAMRDSFDSTLARVDETSARLQLDGLLEHVGNYLATHDAEILRSFVHTFLAMRAAEVQGPSAALSLLVTVGDVAVETARETSAIDSTELVLLLSHATLDAVRLANDLVAEELHRRRAARFATAEASS